MKKFFAILLLLSFTVQITGYHVFFHIKKSHLKKSARQRVRRSIEEEHAETLVFNAYEAKTLLKWEEDNEFRYKGEMYDVISKTTVDGNLVIRCISDKKETELVKNYKSVTKDDFGGPSKKRASLLLKLLGNLFAPAAEAGPGIPVYAQKINWTDFTSSLVSNPREILTPPPQAV